MTGATAVTGTVVGVAGAAASVAAAETAAAAGVAAASNPVGWLIAAVVGAVVVVIGIWVGKEQAMNAARTSKLPVPLRKIIPRARLARRISATAKKKKLEEQAASQFALDFTTQHSQELADSISNAFAKELHRSVRQAALMISRQV